MSIALTAVKRLLGKHDVDPRDIGRCGREGLLGIRGRGCDAGQGSGLVVHPHPVWCISPFHL